MTYLRYSNRPARTQTYRGGYKQKRKQITLSNDQALCLSCGRAARLSENGGLTTHYADTSGRVRFVCRTPRIDIKGTIKNLSNQGVDHKDIGNRFGITGDSVKDFI